MKLQIDERGYEDLPPSRHMAAPYPRQELAGEIGKDPVRPIGSARGIGITLSTLKRSRRSGGLSGQLAIHVSRFATSSIAR